LLDNINIFVYTFLVLKRTEDILKQSEFLRWLKAQGVETKEGANHIKLYLNGKQSVLPRHPAKEIAKGTELAVKKQLGLN
jgi:putative UPF0395 protein plu4353